ncbi:FMN-binding negative transcriptional regulator [Falsihalocynthiibacter arcticus]|uniref:Negative transcriptional regulator n=1 Tax=Falsihalocynthiibacter arcticus TaxID=1579316 RepID=A0A126UYI4_9RHOB|nr:FMN-binding negative transcriptional regulator [Falsihalocynthiibacter arcticus]AML51104.1 negative transcriptional regulator [Falsihalocynthiibacter arcticus]
MHPNPIFHDASLEQNLGFARERGFGTLAINGEDGPLLAHIPFLISDDGKTVELHLVRSNPIARALSNPAQAVVSVAGPDSYISPDWYEIDEQVPTWNYISVHLRGTLEKLEATELRAHLDRLSAANEARLLPKTPWKADKMSPEPLEKMMRMIVPCRMTIENIDGTWKLGQNKPTDARHAAAKMTKAHNLGHETNTLAALMLGSND